MVGLTRTSADAASLLLNLEAVLTAVPAIRIDVLDEAGLSPAPLGCPDEFVAQNAPSRAGRYTGSGRLPSSAVHVGSMHPCHPREDLNPL